MNKEEEKKMIDEGIVKLKSEYHRLRAVPEMPSSFLEKCKVELDSQINELERMRRHVECPHCNT